MSGAFPTVALSPTPRNEIGATSKQERILVPLEGLKPPTVSIGRSFPTTRMRSPFSTDSAVWVASWRNAVAVCQLVSPSIQFDR